MDQQVGDLQITRALGELLDRVAAVFEDPLVTVDEGDRRATRRGVHERGVVGHEAEVLVVDLDLAKLGGADRAVLDRHLVCLAGAVVGDRQRVRRNSPKPRRVAQLSQSSWRSSQAVRPETLDNGLPPTPTVPRECQEWMNAEVWMAIPIVITTRTAVTAITPFI